MTHRNSMIPSYLLIPAILWSRLFDDPQLFDDSKLFNDPQLFDDQLEVWTLIIQKSTVIPTSLMVLFLNLKALDISREFQLEDASLKSSQVLPSPLSWPGKLSIQMSPLKCVKCNHSCSWYVQLCVERYLCVVKCVSVCWRVGLTLPFLPLVLQGAPHRTLATENTFNTDNTLHWTLILKHLKH